MGQPHQTEQPGQQVNYLSPLASVSAFLREKEGDGVGRGGGEAHAKCNKRKYFLSTTV